MSPGKEAGKFLAKSALQPWHLIDVMHQRTNELDYACAPGLTTIFLR
jgi:hypothetical protein